jgi:putative transposase
MPRRARFAPGGLVYHVLNRANCRDILFESAVCYQDFLGLVAECAETDQMRVLAYCAMPNHWHMLLWPREDGDLFRFIHRLSIRHAKRRHMRNGTGGRGHVYQARYKSFVVKSDEHLLVVLRYIEQNPVRAHLVECPGDWRWSSAAQRLQPGRDCSASSPVRVEPSPVPLPDSWAVQSETEPVEGDLARIRASLVSSFPFGDPVWAADVAHTIGLPPEAPPRGRPRKAGGATRP